VRAQQVPAPQPAGPSGGLSPFATLAPAPKHRNPLDQIIPVTEWEARPPGQDVWRFYTIARPDEPGGKSWNGLLLEKAQRRVGLDGGQLRSRYEPGGLRRRPDLPDGPPAQSGQTPPNAAPISYSANGRPFIVLTVGNGGPHPMTWAPLIPEVQNPPDRSATLWVFELPDCAAKP